MKKTVLKIVVPVTICLVTACSSDKHDGASAVSSDDSFFEEGRAHAAEMFESCDDSVKMSLYLLDTRARISDMEIEKGRQPADDYRRGFEDYVRFYDADLADRLF